jgi:acyl-CoA reductase-like NAD-dependent aldehyde dehydrogenase
VLAENNDKNRKNRPDGLLCDFYAEQAVQFLMPEVVETEASKSFVTFQPLGVVLAVMPWCGPIHVCRSAA